MKNTPSKIWLDWERGEKATLCNLALQEMKRRRKKSKWLCKNIITRFICKSWCFICTFWVNSHHKAGIWITTRASSNRFPNIEVDLLSDVKKLTFNFWTWSKYRTNTEHCSVSKCSVNNFEISNKYQANMMLILFCRILGRWLTYEQN